MPAQLHRAPLPLDASWLRAAFPWLSLVVIVPGQLDEGVRVMMTSATAQAGAIVLARDGLSGPEIRGLIGSTFMPETALPLWFRQVLPSWHCTTRNAATTQLLEGLSATKIQRLEERTGPNGRRLWFLLGRALGAALTLQQASPGEPLDEITDRTGYADRRTLERAVTRRFGVRARELRGTTGWEWLLWRFLSGLGEGSSRSWVRESS